MQVQNVSGDARFLPAIGKDVEADEVITVPDALGASLLEQPANWAAPTIKPAKVEE